MVTLGSAAIYVAAAGIVVVEVLSVHIYIERHTYSPHFVARVPKNFWARSASPSRQVGNSVCREHEWHSSGVKEKIFFFFFFFFFFGSPVAGSRR